MKEINDVLKEKGIRALSYKKIGNVIIANTNLGKVAIKKNSKKEYIYNYLNTRNFNYYPKTIPDNEYQIMEYIEDIEISNDQKMLDLINLVSLLHNKTTYFKNVDLDEYKKIYEDLKGNINYLFNYYDDLMTIIESKIYPSPAEFLLSTNISIVFSAIDYCFNKLDSWYEKVKDKQRRRYVIIHNNLDLNHFIKNKNSYLLSWDYSKIDSPIYDLYLLYKKYAFEYDFESLVRIYEKNYPLLEEEKNLFYILISLPDKIELNSDMYECCKKIEKFIDYLYKTEKLISPNNSKDTK